jgi:hypothetical protein
MKLSSPEATKTLESDPAWAAVIFAFIKEMEQHNQDVGVLRTTDAPFRRINLPLSSNEWWSWEPRDADLAEDPGVVAEAVYHNYRHYQTGKLDPG